MRPVDDIRRAVVGDYNVRGVEIAVADLVVLGHRLKAGVQVISDRCGKIGLADLSVQCVITKLI